MIRDIVHQLDDIQLVLIWQDYVLQVTVLFNNLYI